MERYLCIHGHFYQPPRENPWLEAVELQESAYPYHDWNGRITDECYAANAKSRILDGEGRITRIVNNYAGMSYNFGPTLLSWLEEKRPAVYKAILDADRLSAERFGGHGSAVAQGYGHIILPLSNTRDKRTQVIWGARDFERRFGRRPEGMWLPEAAVNTDTLEALAEQGIKFTVLAPHQAARFRPLEGGDWTEATGETGIDPTRAYAQKLPSGRTINLFFYDGPVSQAVAFERLLETGEKFANRLLGAFSDTRSWPQLVHIATDGETYGHHHRHGDMALAYALDYVERNNLAKLTNYGQFLAKHPPTHEVQIAENTSWSCNHGVERWKANCGCNTGGHPDWNQNWRAPLRMSLDWLRDTVNPHFEAAAKEIFRDPWEARDDYIGVVLDRSPERVSEFLIKHAARPLDEVQRVRALKLMELQRQLMLMYTSCGWFFDELSGIETVQVMQYAGRALQLIRDVLRKDLEPEFLSRLETAKSNLSNRPDGRVIYQDLVKPAFIDLYKLTAHYAISSLFQHYDEHARVYAYEADREDTTADSAGRARMLVGRARLTSRITTESREFTYGVLHLGDHILNAGVREFQGDEAYAAMVQKAKGAFAAANYPGLLREMDSAFGSATYTLQSLFKDEQRRALDRILESTLAEVERAYRQVYENHAPLLRFLAGIHAQPPQALQMTAEFVLNAALRRSLAADNPDLERARSVLAEARETGINIDGVTVGYALQRLLGRSACRLSSEPADLDLLKQLDQTVGLATGLPFEVRLDDAQNAVYPLLERLRQAGPPTDNPQWSSTVIDLARKLRLKVD